ncbi:hypothetical protein EW146_g4955 [Bondarzewia mesenterica]|uniref:Uncharacterized protein n=1 Tax=Bondarzewia mesenterica TaxID=1095465 RepID=A0A4S4LSY4_9AGAM|nr:hypothetical protein EW146_g4955 [Bondarzewia mesenterica]
MAFQPTVMDEDITFANLLADLCHGSGVASDGDDASTEVDWHFSEDIASLDSSIATACTAQVAYLRNFKAGWANTGSLSIPLEWLPRGQPTSSNIHDWLHSSALSVWIASLDQHITFLTRSQVIARHDNPTSFEPDFLLHQPKHLRIREPFAPEEAFLTNPLRSISFFFEMATYPGGEDSARSAIAGVFMSTPGCLLKSNFKSTFPAPLQGLLGPSSGDFALLLNPIASYPPKCRDMKASILHPALLLGMKGPAPWPPFPVSISQPASSFDCLSRKLRDLSQLTQPNLMTHILNWHLRCKHVTRWPGSPSLPPYDCLPAWFMQFGILYDAEYLTIIAHVPFLPALPLSQTKRPVASNSISPRFSYLSCVVDRIPLAGVARSELVSTNMEPPILSNFRAALALFSLQKHAFMMAALWEGVTWPVLTAEALAESNSVAPSRTTSSTRSGDGDSFDFDDVPLNMLGLEDDREERIELDRQRAEEVHSMILQWLDSVSLSGC